MKYIDTVLTTHVCKTPSDLESGLRVLLQLKCELGCTARCDCSIHRLISDFTASHPEIVQDAIKYIIFLTNVNHLYDVALGMYDFQLVLMVAQYSQKVDLSLVFPYHRVSMHPLIDYVLQDPKEYLPFLRELRALEKDYQRYRIDDHLERWERALGHLHAAGNSPRCRSERI